MYSNDQYMDYDLIFRESRLSAHLFRWTQLILTFMRVSKEKQEIGIEKLEQEIDHMDQISYTA